ncbi:MAG: L,D-transpeptidase [Anaerolineales bacterium]
MNALPSNRRNRLLFILVLCLSIGGGLVAFDVLTSPVSVAIFGTVTPVTSQEIVWAYANVPKPTYTPISIPVSVPTVMPTVTAISGSMVMEIVNGNQPSNVNQGQAPAIAYGGSKYILVDISEQHMYVYEADALVYSFVASTGIDNATRAGIFQVQSKYASAYGSTWNIWMPSWLGIYYSGGLENGIHALPILPNGATLWAGFLGRPISYGCVVLDSYEAQLLYDWAELGTPVEIRW